MIRRSLIAAALVLFAPSLVFGQSPQETSYTFKVRHETRFGDSVYLVGSLPELGAWDSTRALRMTAAGYPEWSLTLQLPKGARFQYRFLVRANRPDLLPSPLNIGLEGQVREATVPGTPVDRAVTLRYFSGFQRATLRFRRAFDRWESATMSRIGPGRRFGESLWEARVSTSMPELEFVIGNDAGAYDRSPYGGNYKSGHSFLVLRSGLIFGAMPEGDESFGQVRQVRNWYSRILNISRDVYVYLPRNYNSSNRRYPVIYMHDGQNLFGPAAIFGGWRAARAADQYINMGAMKEVIIIGVGNTRNRFTEYVPPEDGGGADRYGRFLIEELKPWVDRSYRTRTGPEDTGVMGSSLGGICSLYLGWTRPDVFGKVGSLSGSYWLKKFTARMAIEGPRDNLTIWLDSGNAGNSADGLENTVGVRDLLLNKGYQLGGQVEHFIDYGAQHNEAAWRGRVWRPMTYLFAAD